MRLLVDTSVWSLALRRDARSDVPEVGLLLRALEGESEVYTTGLVLQELLQGFSGPTARDAILTKFASLPVIVPEVKDHADAATLRNLCRRNGVQVGTIDALIASLAIRFELTLLTTDGDFEHLSRYADINLAT